MHPTTHKSPKRASKADLRQLMREDHERLDQLFTELVAAFQADARGTRCCTSGPSASCSPRRSHAFGAG